MKRVLVSGKNGFLMRNTLKDKDWKISTLINGGKHIDRDLVVHFASPSDSEGFKNKERLVDANIDLTISAVNEANRNNCKLIFASSMAVENIENNYGILKKTAELYIETHCNDYVIMRIPRVYGINRYKGLMKKIRDGEIKNWETEIEYIDIEDFKTWFDSVIDKNGIQTYPNKQRKNTIKEIKDIYCLES